ncbi:MAG: acyl-ACP--UDP-N-acetylglucosamine O-acyltransferase [Kiritimatiellia bacterium]|jgi:UDP-N-acetylglucosamine acyltransferase
MTQIHPTAIVSPGAQIGEGVEIGPYCTIGENVVIGDGTRLISHVVIDGHTTLGKNCNIFPFACLGMQTQDLKYRGGTTYAIIGDNTTLRECVTVNTGTRDGEATKIGNRCHIMAYCHISHGTVLGNEVIMSNTTQLAGETIVEDRAVISGLVGVHQFCRIGSLAMIGGGTAVSQDCPPYMITTGSGSEAAVRGLNTVGLRRHNVPQETRSALKQAYRLLYREGLNHSQACARIQSDLPDLPEIRHLLEFYASSQRGVL